MDREENCGIPNKKRRREMDDYQMKDPR